MVIIINGDYKGLEADLDRIGSMPTPKSLAGLDSVLSAGFAMTQAAVHIDTTSLKQSGKKSSTTDQSKAQWEGVIRYGGPSAGVNNPVDYAIYEKRRAGDHDFFSGLPALHPLFIAAIIKGMKG